MDVEEEAMDHLEDSVGADLDMDREEEDLHPMVQGEADTAEAEFPWDQWQRELVQA